MWCRNADSDVDDFDFMRGMSVAVLLRVKKMHQHVVGNRRPAGIMEHEVMQEQEEIHPQHM